MKTKLLVLFFILSLSLSAKDWTISVTPTNLLFNSLTIGVEKNGWEVVVGFPVHWSLTDPVQRFGIQKSDYDRANMGITSLLIGKKKYFGSWYIEPYVAGRWIDLDFHINPKPSWPINSDFLTDIFTLNLGLSVGYQVKLNDRFNLFCFAGPEIGIANLETSSKSENIKDQDWMFDYYIPHEFREALPGRVVDKMKIRKDGYDVYGQTRSNWYGSIRAGAGISYTFK